MPFAIGIVFLASYRDGISKISLVRPQHIALGYVLVGYEDLARHLPQH